MADEKSQVTFEAPEGFSLPDGVNADEPFQSMATVQQNDDGTLTLLELDGQEVGAPGDGDETDEDAESNPSSGGATLPMTPGAGAMAMRPKKKMMKKPPMPLGNRLEMLFAKKMKK